MRIEQLNDTTMVFWRDERLGRARLQDESELRTCLDYYEFKTEQDKIPIYAENRRYRIVIQASGYPCTAWITRLPQTPVQEAAWRFAEERLARIVQRDGELGVLFLDENRFVPFSQLAYDSQRGFYISEPPTGSPSC